MVPGAFAGSTVVEYLSPPLDSKMSKPIHRYLVRGYGVDAVVITYREAFEMAVSALRCLDTDSAKEIHNVQIFNANDMPILSLLTMVRYGRSEKLDESPNWDSVPLDDDIRVYKPTEFTDWRCLWEPREFTWLERCLRSISRL